MASPVPPQPTIRSASRSRGIQKSPNPSKRDKVRQGKLIRCWTDEEESFLFRSRTQGQKLSYKHIAKRLDKSELACRLHYHHMTVGRKGHRADDEDDDLSEHSDSSAPSTVPPAGDLPAYRATSDVDERRSASTDTSPNPNQLPNFQAFLRGISHHQRSTSMPGAVVGNELHAATRELHTQTSTRAARTLSGTLIREHRPIDAHPYPQPHPLVANPISRPPLLPHQSPPLYTSRVTTSSQLQTSPYGYRR